MVALRIGADVWLTSPRLRGEVGLRRAMRSIVRSNPGEGDYPRVRICRESPSPHPLPAKSGAREKRHDAYPSCNIALRASASPISTKAEVTSGPPTRMRGGGFILFHA